jgi:hypothetical protein
VFGSGINIVKTFGFLVVVMGFLWIIGDCAMWFTQFQHGYWWRRSGELPAGGMIERDKAIQAMRDISLRLNERHRDIVLPAFVMLAGSVLVLLTPGRRCQGYPAAEQPDGPANGRQPIRSETISTSSTAGSRR